MGTPILTKAFLGKSTAAALSPKAPARGNKKRQLPQTGWLPQIFVGANFAQRKRPGVLLKALRLSQIFLPYRGGDKAAAGGPCNVAGVFYDVL